MRKIDNLNKRHILKNAPHRAWNDTEKPYDCIWLIPAGTKHESGYMHIAVVGVNYTRTDGEDKEEYEICAYPDVISTHFPTIKTYIDEYPLVRMDCLYPSRILRYLGNRGKFYVSEALSSVHIKFIPNK